MGSAFSRTHTNVSFDVSNMHDSAYRIGMQCFLELQIENRIFFLQQA